MCFTLTGVMSLCIFGGGGGFVGVIGSRSRRTGSGVDDRDVRPECFRSACLYDSGELDQDLVGSYIK